MSERNRKAKFRRGGGRPPDRRGESGRRPARGGGEALADGPVILYGWHTVVAALANPKRQIRKLWLSENAAKRLADENIDTRVTPEIVRPALIAQRPADAPFRYVVTPNADHLVRLVECRRLGDDAAELGSIGMRKKRVTKTVLPHVGERIGRLWRAQQRETQNISMAGVAVFRIIQQRHAVAGFR